MDPSRLLPIALEHYHAGRFAECEAICRQVLAQNPNHLHTLHLQSLLAVQSNHPENAIQLISRAIAINPNVADYHVNLAEYRRRLGRLDEASQTLRHAIRLEPGNAIAHYNLGVVLAEQRKLDEALAEFEQSVALKPNLVEGYIRLGNEYRRRRRLDESANAFQNAIRIRPDSREAHWNYSLLLLQRGDFPNGWREYEWRRSIESICRPRKFSQPEWFGEALSGQTVFLHVEQAFGDVIQFARFAPKVAERGGRVILESHPEMARLLRSVRGVEQVIPVGSSLPNFDLHCPLLSLGRIFSPEGARLMGDVPYLYADPQLVAEWKKRLEVYQGKLKVGLNWAGRKMLIDGRDRSISSATLAPLAQSKGIAFFSVQPQIPGVESLPRDLEFVNCSADLHDFADTAAIMANLDLIISVDTAAAHLAGALGRPTWTMLLDDADWRWLLDREDSPWYPTMRLFRQQSDGNWEPVIWTVANELNDWARRAIIPP